MNKLLIGNADKTEKLLQTSQSGFLLIDDGEIAEEFMLAYPRARVFDPYQHNFNPLKGMTYRHACDFIEAVLGAFPAGQATLTKEGVPDIFFEALLANPRRLDNLLTQQSKDPSYISAQRMIKRILRSPILNRVFCERPNFTFPTGTKWSASVIAKINRAELGDFDAFVLASLLIGQFKGQVIVPDFGFYGRDTSLIRENRLTAGLNSLSEVSPALGQALLTIKDITVYRTTPQDAEMLAPLIPKAHGKASNITDLEGDNCLSSFL